VPRKTYNPYVQSVKKINRFKGVRNPENPLTLGDAYVGFCEGVLSPRFGELGIVPSLIQADTRTHAVDTVATSKGYIVESYGTFIRVREYSLDSNGLSPTSPVGLLNTDGDARVAKNLSKTYKRNVFSSKDAEWNGINQRRGTFYGKGTVEMSMGLLFHENSVQPQLGLVEDEVFSDAIDSCVTLGGSAYCSSGQSIWRRL
jgi:hypothetical protein